MSNLLGHPTLSFQSSAEKVLTVPRNCSSKDCSDGIIMVGSLSFRLRIRSRMCSEIKLNVEEIQAFKNRDSYKLGRLR
jgi:hypothetical protein